MTQSPCLPLALDERGLRAAIEAANELACDGGAPVADYVSGVIRAYLSAVPASQAVKALEWVQNWPSDPNSQWVLVEEIDRSYTIDPESNVFHVTTSQFPSGEYGRDDMGLHPTLEAAKAAAQADYEARIRSALIAQEPAEGAARARKIIEGLVQFREWVLTKATNADEINLILAENALVENGELANSPYLAVQISEAIDARIRSAKITLYPEMALQGLKSHSPREGTEDEEARRTEEGR